MNIPWSEAWLAPKYRVRKRWWRWRVEEWDPMHDFYVSTLDPTEWRPIAKYRTKDEAVAHLVKLVLEGKNVINL